MIHQTPRRTRVRHAAADVAELSIWVEVVRARIAERRNEVIKKQSELRDERGLVGGMARLCLPQVKADSYMLAGAIQDVQLALLDPADTSGLRETLPRMASRAKHHEAAGSFIITARSLYGKDVPVGGIQSASLPLVMAVNEIIGEHGHQSGALAVISRRNKPTIFSRMLAGLTLQRTRNLLFATVLGEPQG